MRLIGIPQVLFVAVDRDVNGVRGAGSAAVVVDGQDAEVDGLRSVAPAAQARMGCIEHKTLGMPLRQERCPWSH